MPLKLTVLDLALLIRHVLEVVYDGASGQVVEGLVPELLVDLFLTLPAAQEGLDIEDDLPLRRLPTQQPGHHGLAVASVLVGCTQIWNMGLLRGFCLTQLVSVSVCNITGARFVKSTCIQSI